MRQENEETKLLASGEIARRIQNERLLRGWTIYKLAYKSGVSAGHLQRLESGMYAPRIDVLQRVCVALKMEIKFPLPI